MKQIYLLFFGLCTLVISAHAQTVTFDDYSSATDNDLANFFNGDYSFYQIPIDGIAGGAIKLDTTFNNALDPLDETGYAFYNEIFPNGFDSFATSICFKYSAGPRPFLPAAMLMVRTVNKVQGFEDFSNISLHFERDNIFYPTGNMNIIDRFTSSIFEISMMEDGHWYRMGIVAKKGVTSMTDTAIIGTLYFESLGATGLSTPDTIIDSPIEFYHVNEFYNPESKFKVGLCGNKADGAGLLDNFSVTVWYPESEPVSVNEIPAPPAITMPTVFTNSLPINILSTSQFSFKVCDLNGRLIETGVINSSKVLSTGHYPSGMYIISIQDSKTNYSKRIMKP